jgi:hypothetical protein
MKVYRVVGVSVRTGCCESVSVMAASAAQAIKLASMTLTAPLVVA